MSEDRNAILARRRRFLIVALAGVGCAGPPPPVPPTTPSPTTSSSAEPAPTPIAKPEPSPVDSDGDGVPDADDRCPTVHGIGKPDRDELGCPPRPCLMIVAPNEVFVREVVLFPAFSAKLPASTLPILDEIVRLLTSRPELDVEIEGHTQKGEPERFASARAKAVEDHFTKRGIAADRLSVRSYGDTRPVSEDKAKNRRASFRLQERTAPR